MQLSYVKLICFVNNFQIKFPMNECFAAANWKNYQLTLKMNASGSCEGKHFHERKPILRDIFRVSFFQAEHIYEF